jgi:lipoprotein signal peptidase
MMQGRERFIGVMVVLVGVAALLTLGLMAVVVATIFGWHPALATPTLEGGLKGMLENRGAAHGWIEEFGWLALGGVLIAAAILMGLTLRLAVREPHHRAMEPPAAAP